MAIVAPRLRQSIHRCLFIPAIALLAANAACSVGEANIAANQPPPSALPVASVAVERTDLYASYQASSTLTADGEAQVPARASGEVVEILVEEGDSVQQGQVLARIDDTRLQLKLRQTRAQLAKLASEHERLQELHQRGLVSNASYDSLQYEVDALTAAWELDRLALGYTQIRAPINGVIASRDINLGQHLVAGDLAFRISDRSVLVAELRVPQTELASFTAGQTVHLQVAAIADRQFSANVARISPTIDRNDGTFGVTAYIDNGHGLLAPGMFARISVQYQHRENTLALPADSIVEEDGEPVVYRITDGQAERRTVTLGIRDGQQVEILDGVAAGDQIVRSGGAALRDGARVIAMHQAQAITGG